MDGMAKKKISATVSPEWIEAARAATGNDNLSELIERGLEALVERELERRWLEAHHRSADADDLPGEVVVDLGDVPWEESR